MAENPDANEAGLVECLRSLGYETFQAELLVAFVPIGLARPVISRIPTDIPKLSDHVLILKGDQQKKVRLIHVPEFVEALQLGEENFTTGVIPKELFRETARFSVELNLISQALTAETTLSTISAPVLFGLGEAPEFDDWYNRIERLRKEPIKKKFTLAAFGFVYGAVLTLLGFAASGGGHSDLMLMLAIAPAGAGILFWPIFCFTIYDLRSAWSRRIFLLLMAFHYGAFLLYLYQNWESEIHWLPIASSSALFWLGLIFYIMGQLLLWKTFLTTNGLVDD